MPKQSINQVYSSSPSPHFGKIFIGNLQSALNIQTLRKNNIKAIITAAKHYKLNHSNTDLPDYLYLPAHDQTDFDLTIYFEQSYSFIDKCLKYTNVLVHCVAGISRSASIVVAYLMRKLQKSSVEVIKEVKSRREIINPNSGFKLQLRFYESRLKEEKRKDQMVRKIESMTCSKRVVVTEPLPTFSFSPPPIPSFTPPPPTSKHQDLNSIHELLNKSQLSNKQKILQSRRLSFSHRQIPKQRQPDDLLKKGISLDKLKKKNLKLESNKKSFQKMIENNQRRVEERLSKILTISNI